MRVALLCVSVLWLALSCLAADTDTTNGLGEVVFKIVPEKYGISVEYDGESALTGPGAFSVLGDELALLSNDGKEIYVIAHDGALVRTIRFKDAIGNFDMDSSGNGFVSIEDSLYKIDSFIPAEHALKTRFTLKGNRQGPFRIDLLKDNRVRFISFVPGFCVETTRDSVCEVTARTPSRIDSVLINQITLYVGFCKNYYVFLRYHSIGPDKVPHFELSAFNIQDSAMTFSKRFVKTGQDLGCFIMWSYWSRMNEADDCFYLLFYENKQIVVRKFDLQKLLGI